jgi:hypothetical protein
MIDCPKFIEMHKMFHGKFVRIIEVQSIVEIQTIIINFILVDVNVATRSKTTEK